MKTKEVACDGMEGMKKDGNSDQIFGPQGSMLSAVMTVMVIGKPSMGQIRATMLYFIVRNLHSLVVYSTKRGDLPAFGTLV